MFSNHWYLSMHEPSWTKFRKRINFMTGDFETVKSNQSKITNLKLEENTERLDKLINNIEDMKKNISEDS